MCLMVSENSIKWIIVKEKITKKSPRPGRQSEKKKQKPGWKSRK